ncbi:MAG: DUF6268 family outer membrane beta-barrel protein [Bacteroidota bacterium]
MDQTWVRGIVLFASLHMSGQVYECKEVAKFQYEVAPSLGQHYLETYAYQMGATTHLWNTAIAVEAAYMDTRFSFFEVPGIAEIGALERFHRVGFSLGASGKFTEQWNWSAYLHPQLSSTLSRAIATDDLLIEGGFGITKHWHQSRLTLGVERTTAFGRPQWLPYLNYFKAVGELLQLQLGFPESQVTYQFNNRHQLAVQGKVSGNYFHISGNLAIAGVGTVSNAQFHFSGWNFGVQHQYKLQPKVTITTRIGLLNNNSFEIEDTNESALLSIPTDASPYFSMGLQYNLNSNNND